MVPELGTIACSATSVHRARAATVRAAGGGIACARARWPS